MAHDCRGKFVWFLLYMQLYFISTRQLLTNDTIVYDIRSPGHRIVPHSLSNICAEQGGVLSNPGIVTVTVI